MVVEPGEYFTISYSPSLTTHRSKIDLDFWVR
jgi:hypothetical protein